MKYIYIIILIFITSLCFAQRADKHVIILSMDAFRWDYPQVANTPTLDSLRRVGVWAKTKPCFPSNTFPCHYSIATGQKPINHGIVNNNFYDRTLDKTFKLSDQPACFDPQFWIGEPLWSAVERNGLRSAVIMWVGSEVKRQYNPSVLVNYDGKIPYKKRAELVLEQLRSDSIPNLVMWYIQDPDAVSHRYGPMAEETIAVVESLDSLLGYFFAQVREIPDYQKFDIIVTTDHGMAQNHKDKYINLYNHLDNSKVKYCFSGSTTMLEVDSSYVKEARRVLKSIKGLSIVNVKRRYNGLSMDRTPSFVLLADDEYVIDYSESDRAKTGGSHGYDPDSEDMKTIFFAVGDSFKRGYVHKGFESLHIYALIAEILELKNLPKNDANVKRVKGMLR